MTRDEFIAMLDREGWIGVDLDGTLAEWNDQTGPSYIGPPVPAMVNRVKAWIDAGRQVKVVTARMGVEKGMDAYMTIRTWLSTHLGRSYADQISITNQKDLGMLALWDDMAVTVERNSGRPLIPGFGEDDMTSKAKTSIRCTDGTIFSVDLREVYMVSISSDGAIIRNQKLADGDSLVSIFWKKLVRGDEKPTTCPVPRSEALRFKLRWEDYEGK